ncbi:taste receptor type 2 member 41-like [Pseudophryne corroboree]|uniref:taste receptor type 2 member 41-like n=1 Tax=Pseudophryne corroboree TaxID=495146 RepID=UPI003081E8E5
MQLANIALLEFMFLDIFAGLFLNGLIIYISSRTWRNGGYLSPGDAILVALGLCNIIMQTLLTCGIIIYYFWIHTFLSYSFFSVFFAIYNPMCLSSSWMTSWLCIFYCIKITNFQCSVFVLVKSRFSGMLPWLILASVALSVIFISSGYLTALNPAGNATQHDSSQRVPFTLSSVFLVVLVFWCCLPCVLILTSLGTTLTSLVIHVFRMKASTDFSSSKIEAHINGIRTMTLLLVLYIIFYLTQIILSLSIFPFSSPWFWILLVLHFSFCTLQGVILVLGNPKLYNAFQILYGRTKVTTDQRNNDNT